MGGFGSRKRTPRSASGAISEATAKAHVACILQKLDLRDRVQAVIYAYETGLIARQLSALTCLARARLGLSEAHRNQFSSQESSATGGRLESAEHSSSSCSPQAPRPAFARTEPLNGR